MPRKPVYRGGAAKLDSIVDGIEFLTAEHIAQQSGCSTDLIYLDARRGHLCPGKIGAQFVFTKRDVQRWKALRDEVAITTELDKGVHPVDVYLAANGAFTLDTVTKVLHRWARLTGLWVIEGPRGSYARWLERLGLTRVTPRMLRRVVEMMLLDPTVKERAHAVLGVPEHSGRPWVPPEEDSSAVGFEGAAEAGLAEGLALDSDLAASLD